MSATLAVIGVLSLSANALAAEPLLLHRPRSAVRRPVLLAASPPPAPLTMPTKVAASWGVCGFLGILAKAIGRLAPVAVQPLIRKDLSVLQWGMYGASMALFAYMEGYKAFQTKFSPLVVRRALTLGDPSTPLLHTLLAPFYSMGLFHATRKRKIVSWSISIAVAGIIAVVKRLSYPYRSVVDAGVVVGLGWGSVSIAIIYVKALLGQPPTIDPALPPAKEQ